MCSIDRKSKLVSWLRELKALWTRREAICWRQEEKKRYESARIKQKGWLRWQHGPLDECGVLFCFSGCVLRAAGVMTKPSLDWEDTSYEGNGASAGRVVIIGLCWLIYTILAWDFSRIQPWFLQQLVWEQDLEFSLLWCSGSVHVPGDRNGLVLSDFIYLRSIWANLLKFLGIRLILTNI